MKNASVCRMDQEMRFIHHFTPLLRCNIHIKQSFLKKEREILSFVTTRMNLEVIMVSEILYYQQIQYAIRKMSVRAFAIVSLQ